jgi:hypothetical protein
VPFTTCRRAGPAANRSRDPMGRRQKRGDESAREGPALSGPSLAPAQRRNAPNNRADRAPRFCRVRPLVEISRRRARTCAPVRYERPWRPGGADHRGTLDREIGLIPLFLRRLHVRRSEPHAIALPGLRRQSAGLRPCTPARERPLRRRGLSLALPRPRLAPGQRRGCAWRPGRRRRRSDGEREADPHRGVCRHRPLATLRHTAAAMLDGRDDRPGE